MRKLDGGIVLAVAIGILFIIYLILSVGQPDKGNRPINQLDVLKKDLLMIAIIDCESNGRHNVWSPDGSAFGIAQFQLPTFKEMAEAMGFKTANWKDKRHQLTVLSWAIDNNKIDKWECYQKLRRNTSGRV